MENKKLNEQVVVESVEGTEEKKGLFNMIKSKLPSRKTVLKGVTYVVTFVGGVAVGAFGSTLLGNQDDSDEEEIEDNDDINEENIDEEE